eukprot:scaffold11815_cov142-Skeletonema_marinoi.AAC.2
MSLTPRGSDLPTLDLSLTHVLLHASDQHALIPSTLKPAFSSCHLGTFGVCNDTSPPEVETTHVLLYASDQHTLIPSTLKPAFSSCHPGTSGVCNDTSPPEVEPPRGSDLPTLDLSLTHVLLHASDQHTLLPSTLKPAFSSCHPGTSGVCSDTSPPEVETPQGSDLPPLDLSLTHVLLHASDQHTLLPSTLKPACS